MKDLAYSENLVRFGAFEVNLRTGETRKHGIRVKLQGQPHQILAMLLERPGEVVTREEIRQRLWPSDTFVEFEDSVNSAVKKLRRALGDSTDHPVYVETLPRVGYRFIAPVQPATSAVAPSLSAAGAEASLPAARPLPSSRRGLWAAALGACAVLLVIVAAVAWRAGKRPAPTAAADARVMLAVLPFENLTGDAGQEYFSDGLTEEMIGQLGRVDPQRLGVIARTSVMRYKSNPQPLEQVARDLGVQYALAGSVRRGANTVRISAQLIRLADQTHIWSRQYDREMQNLLVLQAEIAAEISDEIQLTLGRQKPSAPVIRTSLSPEQSEAHDLYLQGLYFWNKRTGSGFQQAIEYFQRSIAKDSAYAPAYAGLANSYALFSTYMMVPAGEYMPKARAAALQALQLDANLAEAHTALALTAQDYDYDWLTAEKEYRRAIELNPNYATAHQWYAEHLGFRGRFGEAFQESERARQLDPLSLIIAVDHGALLYYSRQYDLAIEQLRAVLEMDPDFPRAQIINAPYLEKGLLANVLANTERNRRRWGEGPFYWAWLAYLYGRTGHRAEAQRALSKLEELNRGQPVNPSYLALAYLGVDNKDQTLTYLEKAFAQHNNGLTALRVDPAYDPLRSDPRFQDLLRRIGLGQ